MKNQNILTDKITRIDLRGNLDTLNRKLKENLNEIKETKQRLKQLNDNNNLLLEKILRVKNDAGGTKSKEKISGTSDNRKV